MKYLFTCLIVLSVLLHPESARAETDYFYYTYSPIFAWSNTDIEVNGTIYASTGESGRVELFAQGCGVTAAFTSSTSIVFYKITVDGTTSRGYWRADSPGSANFSCLAHIYAGENPLGVIFAGDGLQHSIRVAGGSPRAYIPHIRK